MIIRLSSKLAKKIHYSPTQILPLEGNPYADWSAHLFTADRTQYILITNTVSLYSMVLFGKGIINDEQFLDRVVGYMSEFIQDDELVFVYKRLIMPSTGCVGFSKALNLSVTSCMNDLVLRAKMLFLDRELSPYDVSFHLNRVPRKHLNFSTPREAFLMLPVGVGDPSQRDDLGESTV